MYYKAYARVHHNKQYLGEVLADVQQGMTQFTKLKYDLLGLLRDGEKYTLEIGVFLSGAEDDDWEETATIRFDATYKHLEIFKVEDKLKAMLKVLEGRVDKAEAMGEMAYEAQREDADA